MYTLFKAIYQKYCGTPEYNLSIFGLENTGKTVSPYDDIFSKSSKPSKKSMRRNIKSQSIQNINQLLDWIVYCRVIVATTYEEKKCNLRIWDFGGKSTLRKISEDYYSATHGVIFVMDGRVQDGVERLRMLCCLR